MFEDIHKKARENNIPISALLELTYKCNLDCLHCYILHNNASNQLTTKEIYGLLDQLSEMGTVFLTLSGGEPFLRKDLKDIIEYSVQKRFALRLFTSGTLITEEWGTFLSKKNILEVETSIYGSTPKVHDKITQITGSFDKLINGIKILVNNGIKVNVKFIVTKYGYNDALEVKKLINNLGANFYYDVIITPKDNLDKTPQKLSLTQSEIKKFYTDIGEKIKPDIRNREEFICNAGIATLAVSPDGEVYPCVQIRESAGNIRERKLSDIWKNGDIFKELRSKKITDYKCGSCPLLEFCSPCIGLIKMETGNFNGCSQTNYKRAIALKELYE